MSDKYRLSTTGMSIIGSADGKDSMTIEDAVARLNQQAKRIAVLTEALEDELTAADIERHPALNTEET